MTWTDWTGCYDGGWNGLIHPRAFSHPAKFSYALIQRIIAHGLAEGYRNLEMHGPKWMALDKANMVKLVQGDSRHFAAIVGDAIAHRNQNGTLAVVTSPPYADSDTKPTALGIGKGTRSTGQSADRNKGDYIYGTTEGQIGRLPAGDMAAVVTSPPYEGTQTGQSDSPKKIFEGCEKKYGRTFRGSRAIAEREAYGQTNGQIGHNDGETYWQAVAQVYAQCRLVLRPGGVMAIVIKDYVKNKARVPLCDQTADLLTRLGFTVFERMRCWLTKETTHEDLFAGTVTKRKERKSFFRRLAEKKGSPRIDWEEVIWTRVKR